jgi:hypothetical protein
MKKEIAELSTLVEKLCIEGVNFEYAMKHYKCLKKIQLSEFDKAKTIIVEKQRKLLN